MNLRKPVIIAFAMLAMQHAAANTITVTSTGDSGPGTLRAALFGATNGDTINFSLPASAKIILTSGELRISNSVSILGPGHNNLRVDGNAFSRVFYIRPSNTVTLYNLTVTNGAGGALGGGGIFNDHSTLTVSNCSLLGNTAAFGGGIFNDGRTTNSATLTVVNSIITSNSAAGYGGGLYNVGDTGGRATLTVSNCTIIGNSAGNSGGAIDSKGWDSGFASLTVIASTVSSNSAGQFGGGIHNNGEHSGNVTIIVSGSTLNGNSAHVGGGMANDARESGSATGTVAGCNFSGNASHDAYATGGGIHNNAEFSGNVTLTVSDCTLIANSAEYSGGGIYNDGYGGGSTAILQVANCSLNGNSAPVTGGIYNDGGNSGYARLTVNASTLNDNAATNIFGAGAIFNDGRSGSATLAITNSTISSNTATAMFSAGGILNDGAPGNAILTLIASTLSGNSATNSFSAGSIYNYSATLQIGGTILNAGAGTNIVNNPATVTSLGYNLCSDGGAGRLTNATDQINSNPLLGPLQNNGGATLTHALLPNSPAIDKGKSFGVTTDQRGLLRPYDASAIPNANGGDGSDIGAFEVQAPAADFPIFLARPQKLGNGAFEFKFTNTPGAAFTIFNSTNIALATSNWTAIGTPTEIAPGQFQFTDPQATNRSPGFYRVRAP